MVPVIEPYGKNLGWTTNRRFEAHIPQGKTSFPGGARLSGGIEGAFTVGEKRQHVIRHTTVCCQIDHGVRFYSPKASATLVGKRDKLHRVLLFGAGFSVS